MRSLIETLKQRAPEEKPHSPGWVQPVSRACFVCFLVPTRRVGARVSRERGVGCTPPG